MFSWNPVLASTLLLLGVVSWVAGWRHLGAVGAVSAETVRRWVQVGAALSVVLAVHVVPRAGMLYVAATLVPLVSFYVTTRLGGQHRWTWLMGAVPGSLALLVLLPFCWEYTGDGGWIPGVTGAGSAVETFLLRRAVGIPDGAGMYALQAAFLLVAVADPMATMVGRHRGTAEKSTSGSIGFFLVASVLLLSLNGVIALRYGLTDLDGSMAWAGVIVLAAAATSAERVVAGRWDDFSIAIVTAASALLFAIFPDSFGDLLMAAVVGSLMAWLGFRYDMVTRRGATTVGLLTTFVWWIGGWPMVLPVLLTALVTRGRTAVDLLSLHVVAWTSATGIAFSGVANTPGVLFFSATLVSSCAAAAASTRHSVPQQAFLAGMIVASSWWMLPTGVGPVAMLVLVVSGTLGAQVAGALMRHRGEMVTITGQNLICTFFGAFLGAIPVHFITF